MTVMQPRVTTKTVLEQIDPDLAPVAPDLDELEDLAPTLGVQLGAANQPAAVLSNCRRDGLECSKRQIDPALLDRLQMAPSDAGALLEGRERWKPSEPSNLVDRFAEVVQQVRDRDYGHTVDRTAGRELARGDLERVG